MAIVSFNYNAKSVKARKAIDFMLSTGFFTLTETPMQKRIRCSIESAEKVVEEYRKNGKKNLRTLDDVLKEMRNED